MKRSWRSIVWPIVLGALMAGACPPTVSAGELQPAARSASVAPLESIAGADRYLTAVAVSKAAFPTGAPAVVVATGADWPDALGGAGLAGVLGGPVLLTPPDRLRAEVVAEAARLGAHEVYVLGGPGAVRDSVIDEIRHALPGVRVMRLGGADRYATASRVASEAAGANRA